MGYREQREEKKYSIATLFMFVAVLFVLQTTLFEYFKLFGAKPSLTLVCVCCIAMVNFESMGAVYGAVGGLFVDALGRSFIGWSILLYASIATVIGYFSRKYLKTTFVSVSTICLVSVFCCSLIEYTVFYLIFEDMSILYALKNVILFESLYSLIFVFPIYRCVLFLSNR